jgi:hypothetical protein
MTQYLKQRAITNVNSEELLNNKQTLQLLQDKSGLTFKLLKENRFTQRNGEVVEYQFTREDGTVFHKKAKGTTLIDTLCKNAKATLIRVSDTGTANGKLMGYLIE